MSLGDKYAPLAIWLKNCGKDSVTLSFEEIHAILGFLPPVAYRDNAFWANDRTQSSSYGWFNAGYRTIRVRCGEQCVTFVKDDVYVNRMITGFPSAAGRKLSISVTEARKDIPTPCPDEVEKYLKEWQNLGGYTIQEKAINKLFQHTYPNNVDISEVLIKAVTLNEFYSTQIFKITPVAELIVRLDIDKRLQAGDIALVNDIAYTPLENGMPKRYSFATKYCSQHNSDDFPIYDSYVDKLLKYFNGVHRFIVTDEKDLTDYVVFKGYLRAFQRHFGLEGYNLKQIDQYLWLLGKEKFPKKYKRNERAGAL